MNLSRYALVGEDALCLALAEVLARRAAPHALPVMANVAGGFGPFTDKIAKLNDVARNSMPALMIADGDQDPCPVRQIESWRPRHRSARLEIRLAVKEAESWLLADHVAIASFLAISAAKIPRNPDSLPDPKLTLLQLISESKKRHLKDEMLRDNQLKQGNGYSANLLPFIRSEWNADRAAERSPSLARSIPRIMDLFREER